MITKLLKLISFVKCILILGNFSRVKFRFSYNISNKNQVSYFNCLRGAKYRSREKVSIPGLELEPSVKGVIHQHTDVLPTKPHRIIPSFELLTITCR